MASNSGSRWAVHGATFVLWALVAASIAYWGLALMARPTAPQTASVPARIPDPVDPVAVARLLGARTQPAQQASAPSLAARLVLVGVVAGASRRGTALIAVDGKPARPYRVGTAIDEGLWLQSVQGRRAVLAARLDGPAILTLDLPTLTRQ